MTYWYPNRSNSKEALWVHRHVQSLNGFAEQYVCHFQPSTEKKISYTKDRINHHHVSYRLSAPVPWWLLEILTFPWLVFFIFIKAKKYDVINVHIAYPLMTYFHWIKKWVNKPVVITEHWSAYHFNFGVRKPLPRIQRIFRDNPILITVSKSLKNDIEAFSGTTMSRAVTIPNAVDSKMFRMNGKLDVNRSQYFMLSYWKSPKRPDLVIRAFSQFVATKHENSVLRIAGEGPQLEAIQQLIASLGLTKSVVLIGPVSPVQIAKELNECTAFLHASEYETFSAVCAEAICCGTPVVASAVGAIPEFIDEANGVLVGTNSVEEWVIALEEFHRRKFDRGRISREATEKFSFETVGRKYFQFLKSVM